MLSPGQAEAVARASRIWSRVNQRASTSSLASAVISSVSASAWKPSMIEAGNGQGWLE